MIKITEDRDFLMERNRGKSSTSGKKAQSGHNVRHGKSRIGRAVSHPNSFYLLYKTLAHMIILCGREGDRNE